MAEPKVGVTVISGFLGSGKTTLLRRLVRDPRLGPKVAVIVNDLGELGLDHELIASEGSTPTLRVTSLVSGCVCCTLRSDLGEALLQLGRGTGLGRRPEHILIEPSGIARASEVSFAINALGFDAPVQTDAVITLVDAYNAERSHKEHPELFEDQLRSADLVLLNKSDLLTDEAARAALSAKVAQLAPRASRLWCERAAVDLQLLLGDVPLAPRDPEPVPGAAGGEPPAAAPDPSRAAAPGFTAVRLAGRPAAHGIAAVTLAVPFVVDQAALEDFLEAQADRIFRIKGVVEAAGPWGLGPITVQAVGDRVELDPIPPSSPLAAAPRRLIFIGEAAALGMGTAGVSGRTQAGLEADDRDAKDRVPWLVAELSRCARGGI